MPATTQTAAALPAENVGTTESLSKLPAEISAASEAAQKAKEAQPDSQPASSAVQLLQDAREQLQLRDRFTSETEEHTRAVREAPAQLQTVTAELKEDDASTTNVEIPTTATAEMVDQQLASAKAELNALQERLEEVQAEQQRRLTRMEAIPTELVDARRKHSEANIALQSSVGVDDPAVAQARRLFARAKLAAADAQTTALQAEQARYQAREDLLPAARQLITHRIDVHQAQVAALESRLAELRRAEASASARQLKLAARETGTSHPVVRRVASENTSITASLNLGAVLEMRDASQERLKQLQEQVAATSATFTGLRQKFRSVGYSDALGILLRRQRKELPNLREHREYLQTLDVRLADVNLQLLETQDKVNELTNPDRQAREMVAVAGLDMGTTAARSIRNEVSQLLQARRDYLVKVADAYEKLFQTLLELNTAEESLVQISAAFKSFIDERIFWLPSTERLSMESLGSAASAFGNLFHLSLAKSYAQALWVQAKNHVIVFGMGVILLLLVIGAHHKWKRALHDTLAQAGRSRLAAFKPLLRAFVYSLLYVMPLPLFMVMISWPLARLLQVPVGVSSLAEGLFEGAVMLLALRFTQVLIRKQGVAEVFLAWPETSLRNLRRTFSVLTWVYVPGIILVRMWQAADTDPGMEAARLVLVVLLAIIAVLAYRLFWPKWSVLRGTEVYRPGTLAHRLRYIIFLVVVGGPVVLIVAALMGYLYTALELASRLNLSVWMGLALLLVSETAFFWILVKRRRLAIDEARRRRDAAKAQQTGEADGAAGSADLPPVLAEPSLDIAAISNQAGRLLRVLVLGLFILGLWGIWAEVLPALHYLDSKALWSVSRSISEADPVTGSIQTVDKLVPVTLVSLLLAFLIIAGLVVALRNIPGLLDISVYQRFNVQTGEKYAFNTLIRYLLIIMATAYVLYLLGLQWKQIQWLLAGVSVGLGFGLQEIFANFVSGLILLFERPIRVGDVVTVGDQSGRVSQIRIRATTVVNWDHRILIIPNKELITKSVLNWTLVNSLTRLVITVNVNHGSDFDKAREILLRAAKECPYVLNDPAPAAAIDKMDMNSVDFVLLAHLPNGDNAMDAKHEIISRIERDFKEAGITLATPRLDVKLTRAADPT